VRVKPGQKKEIFTQVKDLEYEISVKEKAERNQANKRVIELLSYHFHKKLGEIRLVSGHHSPVKMFSVRDEEGVV